MEKDESNFISKISFIFWRSSKQIVAIRCNNWNNFFTRFLLCINWRKIIVTFLLAQYFSLIANFSVSFLAAVFFHLNALLLLVWIFVHLYWTIRVISAYWIVSTSVAMNGVVSFSWNFSFNHIFSINLIRKVGIPLFLILPLFLH